MLWNFEKGKEIIRHITHNNINNFYFRTERQKGPFQNDNFLWNKLTTGLQEDTIILWFKRTSMPRSLNGVCTVHKFL